MLNGNRYERSERRVQSDKLQLKQAMEGVESLIQEVEGNLFIPKRFRKAPFTPAIRDGYVKYLREELGKMKDRLDSYDRPQEKKLQIAGAPVLKPVIQ